MLEIHFTGPHSGTETVLKPEHDRTQQDKGTTLIGSEGLNRSNSLLHMMSARETELSKHFTIGV